MYSRARCEYMAKSEAEKMRPRLVPPRYSPAATRIIAQGVGKTSAADAGAQRAASWPRGGKTRTRVD